MRLFPVAAVLALLVLLGIGLTLDPREVPSPLIGKPAPAFSLPRLGSDQLAQPADWRGRAVLVNFFASWCTPCLQEHPLLMRLAGEGVEIIGINYKDDAGAEWLARHGNPYRQVVLDARGSAGLDWGVYGVPETYLVSAQGLILHKHIGPLTDGDWFELRTKLAGTPP